MSNITRIPTSKTLFFSYMADTAAYLLAGTPANWDRMNWIAAENTDWQTSATAAAGFAPLWANKASRTTNLEIDIEKLITHVHTYDHDNHMLDRSAAQSPTLAVTLDFTTFHIKHNLPHVGITGAATARHAVVPTLKQVYMTIKNGGAGQILVGVRPTATAKRNHLLEHYNLELFYEVLAQAAASPNASQLTEHEVYNKSTLVMNLGAANSGQKLHIAGLWCHKTNPALNGGLCAIQSITIS
jgi:hypothetical protein